jgi:hypothetical protein
MACVNQIVSLRLFTHFANVRIMRKANNAGFDIEKSFLKGHDI